MNKPVSLRCALLLALLPLLFWQGCKEKCDDPTDPTCKNYNPCWDKEPVSAAFEMIEVVYNEEWSVKVTTGKHLGINPLKLVALDSGELNHQWIIGTDPRIREGLSETVTFGGWVGSLTVTHIVSGEPRSDCFPQDDGKDTVTQTVEVLPFIAEGPTFTIDGDLPIYGTYRGFHTHRPDHLFDITVYLAPPPTMNSTKRVEITNLPDGCLGLQSVYPGANGFLIGGSGALDYNACWGVAAGLGQLSPGGDSLILRHRYSVPESLALNPPKYIYRETTFIGIRQ